MKDAIPADKRSNNWLVTIVLVCVGFGLVWTLISYHSQLSYLHKELTKNLSPPTARPTSVVIAKARLGDMPVTLSALGNVAPLETITIKSQVNGQLMNVLFTEGKKVDKGELLAEINPEIYKAQLLQYEGQLLRDEALLANAKLDLERYRNLLKKDSISQQTVDTQEWLVKQYEGTIKLDLGLVENARININYCDIKAPTAGIIGLSQIDPGNIIQTTDDIGLAIINKTTPITVIFSIPEDNIPEVKNKIAANISLPVEAFDRAQVKSLAKGIVKTLDNQIDVSTGTVKLKAEFTNEEDNLFSNQFVNIQLLVDTLSNVIIVPTAAIQHGAEGDFVYVVKNNNTVEMKKVTVGVSKNDEQVIHSGVQNDDWLVVEGVDKLKDGAPIITSLVNGKGKR